MQICKAWEIPALSQSDYNLLILLPLQMTLSTDDNPLERTNLWKQLT